MAGTFHGKTHLELIANLKERFVIKSDRVEQAMRAVDRRDFFTPFPYHDSDSPQRLGDYGWIVSNPISAPYMHASALEILSSSLKEGATALDVGFGSGYLTTCMGIMVGKTGRVVGIDETACKKFARENVRRNHNRILDSGRIRFFNGDAANGYIKAAPYDAIYVGAGAEVVLTALIDQLKPGGTMLIPMGPEGGDQQIQKIVKEPNGVIRKYPCFKVRFGPKTEKKKDDDDIPEQLRCPICFEVPQAEIYQCKNGHTICSLCEANVKECPQCRIPIPVNGELIRNRALESLLDNFTVACPNQEKGCKGKLLKKNVKDHLSTCIHSKCVQLCKKLFPGDSCNFWTNSLTSSTSAFHFLSAHKAIKMMGESVSITVANIKLLANHASSDVLWEPILLTCNGGKHFMILTIFNRRDRSISWSCLNLDSYDENVEDYEVEYFIESLSKNVPHIKWKCPPLSVMNCVEVVSDPVFRIPVSKLEKYYMAMAMPIGADLTILVSVKSSSGVHTAEHAKSVTIRSDYILSG